MISKTYIFCKRFDCIHNNGKTCSKYSVKFLDNGCSEYSTKDIYTIAKLQFIDNYLSHLYSKKFIKEASNDSIKELIFEEIS